MDFLSAIFLATVQGLTEWLPISSSGHLALAQHFFGIKASIAFDIVLHLGTLLAVLAYYRNELRLLASGALQGRKDELRYALLLLLAAIPTAIIGFAAKDFFAGMFASPLAVACALAITGVFLILASRAKEKNANVNTPNSLAIGCAQGIAVAPGISRSGATIGTALLLGIRREEAAKFSFLAGILPILGAAALEGKNAVLASGGSGSSSSLLGVGGGLLGGAELLPVLVGFLVAAVVGYLSIGLLLRVLKESKLQWFGYYCLALAALVAIIILV